MGKQIKAKTLMSTNTMIYPVIYLFIRVSLLVCLYISQISFITCFSIKSESPNTCLEVEKYFDISGIQCKSCPQNQDVSNDGLSCQCMSGYYIEANTGNPSSQVCSMCDFEKVTSEDGWACIECSSPDLYDELTKTCTPCNDNYLPIENDENGVLLSAIKCTLCEDETQPNYDCNRCERCHWRTLENSFDSCDCQGEKTLDGLCFGENEELIQDQSSINPPFLDEPVDSWFFSQYLQSAEATCKYDTNLTSCQMLGNMCVMLDYDVTSEACLNYIALRNVYTDNIGDIIFWKENLPWLYFFEPPGQPSSSEVDDVLKDDGIQYIFSMDPLSSNGVLNFVVAKYSATGNFIGFENIFGGIIQLCQDKPSNLDAAFSFGTTYIMSCKINAKNLLDIEEYENIFFDMYLNYSTTSDSYELYAIPVLLTGYIDGSSVPNVESDSTQWVLTRRFFLVDNILGKTAENDQPQFIRYAKSISIEIELQTDNDGNTNGMIYPPLLNITYSLVKEADYENNQEISITFEMNYSMDLSKYKSDVAIAMGVISGLAAFWAMIKTNAWRRRAGIIPIEMSSILKFFFFLFGSLANAFFLVTFGASLWWLIFFKQQDTAYIVLPSAIEEFDFIIYISCAFVFKLLEVIHILFVQCTVDLFFVDWERSKARIGGTKEGKENKDTPVSAWRTFFIANEWNEIQTRRKINTTFQLFTVILFLEVIGFANVTTTDPISSFSDSSNMYTNGKSRILRFGIAASIYLLVALIQWLFYSFIYERFVEDYMKNFIDLCSVANVSIFILVHRNFGFYIHGRSPHGKADTNMREMQQQLRREEDNLVGQRGLVPNTEQQTFEMLLPEKFRDKYDKIYQPVLGRGRNDPQRAQNRTNISDIDQSLHAYATLNRFLSSFIDHAIQDMDFIVKDKLLLEQILDMEFMEPVDQGFFYNDDGHSFSKVLFRGNENVLLLFELLFFCMVDLVAQEYILSAIITYFIIMILNRIRDSFSENNLAKKTLVDERFLI